jgi:hypothetical protein
MPTPEVGLTPESLTDGQKIGIAHGLLTDYLNGFRSPHTPLDTRLLDFRGRGCDSYTHVLETR